MIKLKKIKPLGSTVVVTSKKYDNDIVDGTLITKVAGALKEFQTVIAVGPFVKYIKEGDLVRINPRRYAVKQFSEDSVKKDLMKNHTIGYDFPFEEVNGETVLLLQESDIDFVIDDFEETADSTIIQDKKKLIV